MAEDSSVSVICGCFLKWCFEPLTLVDEGISWGWEWGWMVRLSSTDLSLAPQLTICQYQGLLSGRGSEKTLAVLVGVFVGCQMQC